MTLQWSAIDTFGKNKTNYLKDNVEKCWLNGYNCQQINSFLKNLTGKDLNSKIQIKNVRTFPNFGRTQKHFATGATFFLFEKVEIFFSQKYQIFVTDYFEKLVHVPAQTKG